MNIYVYVYYIMCILYTYDTLYIYIYNHHIIFIFQNYKINFKNSKVVSYVQILLFEFLIGPHM